MERIDPYTHVSKAARALSRACPLRRAAVVLAIALATLGAPALVVLAGAKVEPDEIPQRLADTGLYSDIAAHEIAPGVLAFEPQYPLWTDGATKRRWIRLPSSTAIDASDPDHLVFPVGTRLWKEFSLGHRVETRYLFLGRDRRWRFATYVWNADGSDAVLAPERGVPAAAEASPGVPYDIPGRADCRACHEAGPDTVLGFTVLQLSSDRDPLAPHAAPPSEGALDLDDLVRLGLVRGLPRRFVESPPRIEARNARERAALGYLAANCGMCHSSDGALAGLGLDLSYPLGRTGEPPAVATTLGRPSRFRWPGDCDPARISPSTSELGVLPRRMASRQPLSQMPPLGTHLPDAEALELVTSWIREELAPARREGTDSSPLHHDPSSQGFQP